MITQPFQWIPGHGQDETALARLRSALPRPKSPMGEAWFMGEKRRMFTELMGDLTALPTDDLIKPLVEIATGTGSFGPRKEWSDWFHYLLGHLIPLSHSDERLLENLITAFMSQYPRGIAREPYKGFRADVLNTLGRTMMDPACWAGDRIVIGSMLQRGVWPSGMWNWFDASGDLSTSLFFCLKYLSADEIAPWTRSALAIPCPHWRAQILVWLVGAHGVLTGEVRQPSDFGDIWPRIRWDWSHCLDDARFTDGPAIDAFFPLENCRQMLDAVTATMTEDKMLDWLASFAEYDYLEAELADLPGRFCELYLPNY
jgi:hypothetical protein